MTTVYMDRNGFREDMRNPRGASRAHAICRRLLGTPSAWPNSVEAFREFYGRKTVFDPWYGAHYWAACTANEETPDWDWGWQRWACEATGGNRKPTRLHAALWELAKRRVLLIVDEAMALATSVQW